MENQTLSHSELSNLIDDDCLLLTANSRQRRFLLKRFSESSHAIKENSTPLSPDRLLSFNQWLSDAWQQLHNKAYAKAARLLINPQQNLTLWQQVIDQSEESEKLICPELLAKQASSAWQLLEEWEIPVETLGEYTHPESQILKQWGLAFNQRCEVLSLISDAQQCEIIKQAFLDGVLQQHQKIIMFGFDDLSPLRIGLCKALSQECTFVQLQHIEQNNSYTLACDDAEDEIRRCAQFVRNKLEHAQREELAPPRIGIIDPKLGQRRDLIERIFCEELEPQFIHSKTARYTLPFNFSAGFPLANCPIIESALSLLSLNQPQLDVERLCQLLHSPFWHFNAELNNSTLVAERCQLEYQLRYLQQSRIRSSQFRQCADKVVRKLSQQIEIFDWQSLEQADNALLQSNVLSQSDAQLANGSHLESNSHQENKQNQKGERLFIAERLENFFQAQQRRPDRNSAKQWSQIFYQQLEGLNWPGNRRLDSNEYQQVMQFQSLLESLLSLDHLDQLYTASELLSQLQQLASSHHFQAKTPDSPVQVLGILEGAGQAFDYCWVLGMEQKQWPPSPQANPLLPIELQRQHNMPHASAERELFFANQLTQSYRLCAPHVIFSYPSREGEEQLQCSPLIVDSVAVTSSDANSTSFNENTELHDVQLQDEKLQDVQPEGVQLEVQKESLSVSHFCEQSFQRRQFQWVDNRQGPTLSNTEKKLGGSGVLKQQALCPFNAFAQYRLGAKPWPELQIGISAIERGNILHLALETFWAQYRTQAALLALNDSELADSIKQHINDAIEQSLLRRRDLGPRFRQLEAERLLPIITAFISIDKERPDFVVDGIETSRELKLGPLRLQLRLDRLDKLIDASTVEENKTVESNKDVEIHHSDEHHYVVVDYKTGQCDIKSWLGSRPDEPQLPLYSLSDERICAITFAQLNAKAVKYIGISDKALALPGVDAVENENVFKKIKSLDSRVFRKTETSKTETSNTEASRTKTSCTEANSTESISTESISWEDLRQQWHSDLLTLAIDYSQGQAQLDFKDPLAKRYSEDLIGVQRLKEFDSKRRYWNEHPAQLQQTQFDLSL